MLAVFETFLQNTHLLYSDNPGDEWQNTTFELYLPKGTFDDNYIRWHIAVFCSEFMIDVATLNSRVGNGSFQFEEHTDCLNWTDYKTYCELKKAVKK